MVTPLKWGNYIKISVLISTTIAVLCIGLIYFIMHQDTTRELDTLVLTSVVFRHGERTPDKSFVYPNDPYINNTYRPIGVGQLTYAGKKRSLKLGKILRNRYKSFLGDEWDAHKYESYSSSYPRTQMTLQIVHAVLFPAQKDQCIDNDFIWQPVDYIFYPAEEDHLITTYRGCPTLFDEIDEFEANDGETQNIFEEKKELLQYLTLHSGWYVNKTRLAFFLYGALKSQAEYGLTLPQWADDIFPEKMYELAVMFSRIYANNLKFRRVMIGNLLKKITTISQQKASGVLKPSRRKMYIYSGHETNIIGLLGAFGLYDHEDIPYNSFMLFEVHNIDNVYGMKVYYHNYVTADPVLLDIKNCGKFCPIDQFYELHKDNFPGDNWCDFK